MIQPLGYIDMGKMPNDDILPRTPEQLTEMTENLNPNEIKAHHDWEKDQKFIEEDMLDEAEYVMEDR